MKQRQFSPLPVLAVVAALLLGACSSGGGDDSGSATTQAANESAGDTTRGDDTQTEDTAKGGSDGGSSEGSASGGGDAQAYIDAIVRSMGDEDDEVPLSAEQAQCLGSRFLDTIGLDRLKSAGISPDDIADDGDEITELGLSREEGNALYDHYGNCGIDLREMMIQGMAEDDDTSSEVQACLEGAVTEENLRAWFVTALIAGDDAAESDPEAAALFTAIMTCSFMGMDTSD